ncbi:transmembrane protein 17 isoform X3 [Caretta caretta]|uniref:transmembrane protein 17 isoform X3 n=1 Tax=Caretta caretta TaxID=8467 RepID=UPI003F4C4607
MGAAEPVLGVGAACGAPPPGAADTCQQPAASRSGVGPQLAGSLPEPCCPAGLSAAWRSQSTGRGSTHNEIVSSLPLQMSLYFNLYFFPFWWVSSVVMLQLKYPVLPDYYKFILVTVIVLVSLIEAIRLYLGYMGNLQEKVPELAGFWLLSLLLQLPIILFLLFNDGLKIQPLERAVHIIFALFLTFQVEGQSSPYIEGMESMFLFRSMWQKPN